MRVLSVLVIAGAVFMTGLLVVLGIEVSWWIPASYVTVSAAAIYGGWYWAHTYNEREYDRDQRKLERDLKPANLPRARARRRR